MKDINISNDEKSNDIEFTTYDRLLRAWENTKELVRDFEKYSKHVDEDYRDVFKKFAEEQGMQASEFRRLLLEYKDKQRKTH